MSANIVQLLRGIPDPRERGLAPVLHQDAASICAALLRFPSLPDDFRRDAQLAPFFARELEFIFSQTFDIVHPELKMANGEVLPIDTSIDTGAESYTYYQFDSVGIAQLINTYAAKDLPRANIRGAKFTANIESLGASYGWNIQDLRNARMVNRPLESSLAAGARRAHDQAWNTLGLFGDEAVALSGFLNHPNITISDAAVGAGASTLWSLKTPDEIIADTNDAVNSPLDLTNGVESVDRVLMPLDQFTLISTTPRSGTSDTTILEFLRRVHPGVTFGWLNELAAAKSGGELTQDALIAYKFDTNKANLVIPQPFEQFPVQQDGLEFVVATHSRIGGVKVPYPLSIHRKDGI